MTGNGSSEEASTSSRNEARHEDGGRAPGYVARGGGGRYPSKGRGRSWQNAPQVVLPQPTHLCSTHVHTPISVPGQEDVHTFVHAAISGTVVNLHNLLSLELW